MKKLAIIAGYAPSLINFRLDLIKSYQNKGYHVYALAPSEGIDLELLSQFKFYNIDFVELSGNRTGNNPFQDYFFYKKIYKELKRIQPTVVISYTIKPVIYGGVAAGKLKIPKIVALITGRGSAFDGGGIKSILLKSIVSILYKKSLANATHVIFQNENDLNYFYKKNLLSKAPTKIVHGSGINLKKFKVSDPVTEPISFLLVCRLIREKGVMEYVKAAEILKKKYPTSVFKILGPADSNPNGISLDDLKSYVDKGVVSYLGVTNEVLPFFQKSSVFVLPTYYNEGLPRTLLEALATGRPIITTDHPGCRETVIEGKNGFLIPTKNITELVNAMEKYINDINLISKHGEESRLLAERRFDVNIINKEMNDFILN